jgi:hypothetical protein
MLASGMIEMVCVIQPALVAAGPDRGAYRTRLMARTRLTQAQEMMNDKLQSDHNPITLCGAAGGDAGIMCYIPSIMLARGGSRLTPFANPTETSRFKQTCACGVLCSSHDLVHRSADESPAAVLTIRTQHGPKLSTVKQIILLITTCNNPLHCFREEASAGAISKP